MKQLELYNPQFQELQAHFTDWLLVLGYSESTLQHAPLHFLATQQIGRIRQVKREQVKTFFSYLSERSIKRDGGRLSMAYVGKYWLELLPLTKDLF